MNVIAVHGVVKSCTVSSYARNLGRISGAEAYRRSQETWRGNRRWTSVRASVVVRVGACVKRCVAICKEMY